MAGDPRQQLLQGGRPEVPEWPGLPVGATGVRTPRGGGALPRRALARRLAQRVDHLQALLRHAPEDLVLGRPPRQHRALGRRPCADPPPRRGGCPRLLGLLRLGLRVKRDPHGLRPPRSLELHHRMEDPRHEGLEAHRVLCGAVEHAAVHTPHLQLGRGHRAPDRLLNDLAAQVEARALGARGGLRRRPRPRARPHGEQGALLCRHCCQSGGTALVHSGRLEHRVVLGPQLILGLLRLLRLSGLGILGHLVQHLDLAVDSHVPQSLAHPLRSDAENIADVCGVALEGHALQHPLPRLPGSSDLVRCLDEELHALQSFLRGRHGAAHKPTLLPVLTPLKP
mmetsp:Transcript_14049/g.44703  ORF Transcript_14049/g.44703 Transcript_14049/m.44703 type:complete len:339 (-) Transcript_14049:60-1076(-)